MELKDETTVLEDVDNLDAEFGYFRPLDERDEDASPAQRGRPPKDPTEAMSDREKANRRAMLIAAYEKSRNGRMV